jgi:hypothetical protein
VVLFGKAFIALGGEVEITFFQFYFFLRNHAAKIPFSYLVTMIVVVNRFFFRKRFTGIALWPFVIVKNAAQRNDFIFLNHERIHLRQQMELGVVFFYVWYGLEFLLRWVHYKSAHRAYRNIGFEREAYANENDLLYLERRSFWGFWGYL